jgi:hypothetical protein
MKTATGRLTSAGTLFTSGMTATEMSAAKGTPDTIEKSATSNTGCRMADASNARNRQYGCHNSTILEYPQKLEKNLKLVKTIKV